MIDRFQHIWNQLVLCSQFELYGEAKDFFDAIERQSMDAKENRKITDRQFIILVNAAREWGDILAKQEEQKNSRAKEKVTG